jgi:hypothetical protein
MKTVLIIAIFFLNSLFADYTYGNKNSGKIDMHGGNNDGLVNKKSSFENFDLNSLDNKFTKPKEPKEPEVEILEEKNLGELKDLGL